MQRLYTGPQNILCKFLRADIIGYMSWVRGPMGGPVLLHYPMSDVRADTIGFFSWVSDPMGGSGSVTLSHVRYDWLFQLGEQANGRLGFCYTIPCLI